jgi:hypothetical protein
MSYSSCPNKPTERLGRNWPAVRSVITPTRRLSTGVPLLADDKLADYEQGPILLLTTTRFSGKAEGCYFWGTCLSPWWFLLKCLLLICFYRTKWCVQTLPRRYHTHSGIGNRMVWLSRAHILNLRYTGIRPNAWFWPKSVPNVYQGWRDLVPLPSTN